MPIIFPVMRAIDFGLSPTQFGLWFGILVLIPAAFPSIALGPVWMMAAPKWMLPASRPSNAKMRASPVLWWPCNLHGPTSARPA